MLTLSVVSSGPTMQNDLGPLRRASAPSGHGETGASFWQAQRAGPRLLEAV